METSAGISDMRLTPRQMELLRATACFQANRCYSPTISELADELNISRSTAFEHLLELQKKGLLQTLPGKARSLRLTTSGQELLNRMVTFEQSIGSIPLLGVVAAGQPIDAVENNQTLSLSSYFGISEDMFALEVRGDSMIADDIKDGDYIICRRTPIASDGQLVVAIVDEQNATVKRFYKEHTCFRLEPANEQYEPIYTDNCRIEGVVVGLIRRF